MTDSMTEDMVFFELAGELALPCDYAGDTGCTDQPASWAMFKCCPVCDERGAKLVCEGCKDARMSSEMGVYCQPGCGEVVAPARHMYSRIESLNHG